MSLFFLSLPILVHSYKGLCLKTHVHYAKRLLALHWEQFNARYVSCFSTRAALILFILLWSQTGAVNYVCCLFFHLNVLRMNRISLIQPLHLRAPLLSNLRRENNCFLTLQSIMRKAVRY